MGRRSGIERDGRGGSSRAERGGALVYGVSLVCTIYERVIKRAATSATLPRTTQTSVPLYGPLGLAPTRSATAPQRASPSGSVRPRGPADAHAAVHGPPPEARDAGLSAPTVSFSPLVSDVSVVDRFGVCIRGWCDRKVYHYNLAARGGARTVRSLVR